MSIQAGDNTLDFSTQSAETVLPGLTVSCFESHHTLLSQTWLHITAISWLWAIVSWAASGVVCVVFLLSGEGVVSLWNYHNYDPTPFLRTGTLHFLSYLSARCEPWQLSDDLFLSMLLMPVSFWLRDIVTGSSNVLSLYSGYGQKVSRCGNCAAHLRSSFVLNIYLATNLWLTVSQW